MDSSAAIILLPVRLLMLADDYLLYKEIKHSQKDCALLQFAQNQAA